jgi:hypothetical protein
MISAFSDSLQAVFWAALLSLLGYVAWARNWARRSWPRIVIKAERQRIGDIEMTDIAICYSGWGKRGNADRTQPPTIECSIYVAVKHCKY